MTVPERSFDIKRLAQHDEHMEIVNLAETEPQEPGALVGAIDVGSNAIRLGIAAQDDEGAP